MRLIINIVLFLVILFLAWILIDSVREPIRFNAEYTKRKDAVKKRLEDNRTAQVAFRSIKKGYCPTYDSLIHVLRTDSFQIPRLIDKGVDPKTNESIFETLYTPVSAKDSLEGSLGINLDSIMYVPYSLDGDTFAVRADTLTVQGSLVPVISVNTQIKTFMSEYVGDDVIKRYQRYDQAFEPDKIFGYGSLTQPTTGGNWE